MVLKICYRKTWCVCPVQEPVSESVSRPRDLETGNASWKELLTGFVFTEGFISQIESHVDIYFSKNLLQNLPPDLSQCVFVIEQALSVRALQELVTSATNDEAVSTGIYNIFKDQIIILSPIFFSIFLHGQSTGLGSGHKTLLYGNAILLRHSNSNMVSVCIRLRNWRPA